MKLAPLSIVVAMTERRCIGGQGKLLWRASEDLQHFKALTLGHAIVMGRSTFESIGRPLPSRRNIVITSRALAIDGIETASTFAGAVELARTHDPHPFVIGGARVYEAALPLATELHITLVGDPHLGREADCDTFFPPWNEEQFVEVSRRIGTTPGIVFTVWARRHGGSSG